MSDAPPPAHPPHPAHPHDAAPPHDPTTQQPHDHHADHEAPLGQHPPWQAPSHQQVEDLAQPAAHHKKH
ncbi:MAG: hypothetical protein AAF797_04680, partial [Planctomycetota bacterium]